MAKLFAIMERSHHTATFRETKLDEHDVPTNVHQAHRALDLDPQFPGAFYQLTPE